MSSIALRACRTIALAILVSASLYACVSPQHHLKVAAVDGGGREVAVITNMNFNAEVHNNNSCLNLDRGFSPQLNIRALDSFIFDQDDSKKEPNLVEITPGRHTVYLTWQTSKLSGSEWVKEKHFTQADFTASPQAVYALRCVGPDKLAVQAMEGYEYYSPKANTLYPGLPRFECLNSSCMGSYLFRQHFVKVVPYQ